MNSRHWKLFLTILVTLAVLLVVLLTEKLNDARHENIVLTNQQRIPAVGMYVPTYETRSLNGNIIKIGDPSSGTRQVIFAYNTSCPHCEASIPAWNRIADDLRRVDVDVIGISLDSLRLTEAYNNAHDLSFQSTVLDDPRLIALHRFHVVPQAVVVEPGGRIAHLQIGRLEFGPAVDSLLESAQPDSEPYGISSTGVY